MHLQVLVELSMWYNPQKYLFFGENLPLGSLFEVIEMFCQEGREKGAFDIWLQGLEGAVWTHVRGGISCTNLTCCEASVCDFVNSTTF